MFVYKFGPMYHENQSQLYPNTLTCQIIVQDHLIVQVADFSEINKRVGPNKTVQEEFSSHLSGFEEKISEIDKRLGLNKVVQEEFFSHLCR